MWCVQGKMVDPDGEDHIRAAFQMFDTDDSGSLSHEELHEVGGIWDAIGSHGAIDAGTASLGGIDAFGGH